VTHASRRVLSFLLYGSDEGIDVPEEVFSRLQAAVRPSRRAVETRPRRR
jgi:hypothetical protein